MTDQGSGPFDIFDLCPCLQQNPYCLCCVGVLEYAAINSAVRSRESRASTSAPAASSSCRTLQIRCLLLHAVMFKCTAGNHATVVTHTMSTYRHLAIKAPATNTATAAGFVASRMTLQDAVGLSARRCCQQLLLLLHPLLLWPRRLPSQLPLRLCYCTACCCCCCRACCFFNCRCTSPCDGGTWNLGRNFHRTNAAMLASNSGMSKESKFSSPPPR